MLGQAARRLLRQQGLHQAALAARGGVASTSGSSQAWADAGLGGCWRAERRHAFSTQSLDGQEADEGADALSLPQQPQQLPEGGMEMPFAGFKLPDFGRRPSEAETLLGGPDAFAAAAALEEAQQGRFGAAAAEAIRRLSQTQVASQPLAGAAQQAPEQRLDGALLDSWADLLEAEDWEGALALLRREFGIAPGELPARLRGLAPAEGAKRQQLPPGVPLPRVRTVDAQGRAYATGKRKTSIARVWLREPSEARRGQGNILVNGRPLDEHFKPILARLDVIAPFDVTNTIGKFDVKATVHGGGTTGQAQAVRHGIAKALQAWDPQLRPPLKAHGFLTRDSRIVERKKPGKAKARKSFQWVKR